MNRPTRAGLVVAGLILAPGLTAAADDPAPRAQEAAPNETPAPRPGVVPVREVVPGLDAGAAELPPGPAPAMPAELPADLGPGGDPFAAAPTDEPSRLRVYGFADIGFWKPFLDQGNPWGQFLPSKSSFLVGNINVYLDTTITEKVRSLVEVRYLYSPQGATSAIDQTNGNQTLVDNTVMDPAEFGRSIRWGGLLIERASLEYRVFSAFSVRAGQFLTPYGIWNVDHGSPTLVGIRRPYIVREQLFPERQTGLEFYGQTDVGSLVAVGYHLTLSNGRGPIDAYQDLDSNKAVGGRVYVQTLDGGRLAFGLSGYRGRSTEVRYQWGIEPGASSPSRKEIITEQFDELSLAADLRLNLGQVLLQGEIAYSERARTPAGRAGTPSVPNTVDADNRRGGGYLLGGYRTPWFGTMPYVLVEYFNTAGAGPLYALGAGEYGNPFVVYLGLNVRPIPDVVLKLEYAHATFVNEAPGSWGTHKIKVLQAQVAWAF